MKKQLISILLVLMFSAGSAFAGSVDLQAQNIELDGIWGSSEATDC